MLDVCSLIFKLITYCCSFIAYHLLLIAYHSSVLSMQKQITAFPPPVQQGRSKDVLYVRKQSPVQKNGKDSLKRRKPVRQTWLQAKPPSRWQVRQTFPALCFRA